MKAKASASNVLGVGLVLVMLACTLSRSIQQVHAQAQIVVPGSATMWTSQRYYSYGQEIYVYIVTQYPIYRARLYILQWGGPNYGMSLGSLWPGQQYTIDIGVSSSPQGQVNLELVGGYQHEVLATATCWTGP